MTGKKNGWVEVMGAVAWEVLALDVALDPSERRIILEAKRRRRKDQVKCDQRTRGLGVKGLWNTSSPVQKTVRWKEKGEYDSKTRRGGKH